MCVVEALVEAFVCVVEALVEAFVCVVEALVEALVCVVEALVEAFVCVVEALVEAFVCVVYRGLGVCSRGLGYLISCVNTHTCRACSRKRKTTLMQR